MRSIVTLLLIVGAILGAPAAAAAGTSADAGLVRVTLPAAGSAAETLALEFSLPGQAAAVDGRILFDTTAAEVVGIAPAGGGSAMAPQPIDGGVAFGAYGLRARGGQTTLRVVIAPLTAGQLELRLVIDAAANGAGARLGLRRSSAVGTTRIGSALRHLGAPAEPGRFLPRRAASAVRDLVADGALGKMDLDVARAGWELAHLNGSPCTNVDPAADANGDGCIDIVDIQAVVAGQGMRTGLRLRPTGDTKGFVQDTSSTSGAANVRAAGMTTLAEITPTPTNTFVVTSTSDTADANNGDGLCRDSQNRCTLRAAITESNWQRGDNVIHFNLTGTVPVAIQLGTNPMSLIQDRTGGLLIDGYSQPGSRVNTAQYGSNAIMGVELRGTQSSPRGNAFRVTSANNVIRGLSFIRFYRPIVVDGAAAQGNLLAGNWFGFTRTGAVEDYRGRDGIKLNVGAHHNQIGTSALADRNVLGNFTHAIDVYGPGTDLNVVHNNLLCTTPSGNTTASCSTGVDHNFGPKRNRIGGLGAGEANVVGRTTLNGIEISHGWNPDGADVDDTWHNDRNEVLGNWVGFRGDGHYDAEFRSAQNNPGTADNGNGINAYDGSNFNLIEGNYVSSAYDGIQTMSPNSTGNIIRNNIIGVSPRGEAAPVGRYGINIRNSTRTHFVEGNIIRNTASHGIALTQKDVLWIRISRNIVTDTTAAAIFLAVNPNGSNPPGANNLQPAPVITSATTARIRGTGQTGATVEVYRATRDAGQSGLPVEYLGSATVAAGGLWELTANVPQGIRVTALQINPANNTSALGPNVTVTQDSTPSGTLASDAFGRTSTDSWGLADVGGAWTTAGTAANFDVANGQGTMRVPQAGNTRSALLTSVNSRDVDITFRVAADKVAAGGAFVAYAVARRNTNSEYRGRLIFNANGTISVNASALTGGAENSLGTPVVVGGLTQQAGRFFWLRLQVTGADPTTVRVKVWQAGQSEPAAWAFSATDTRAVLQVAGNVGLRTWLHGQVSNAAVVFSFDDYSVRPVP